MAYNSTGTIIDVAATGELTVGDGGIATITVDLGEHIVTASNASAEPNLNVGVNGGGDGSVTIDGAGNILTLQGTGDTDAGIFGQVGAGGGNGLLDIKNGGVFRMLDTGDQPTAGDFSNTEFFQIGRGDGSNGNVLVDGANSEFRIEGDAPGMQIGRDGGTGFFIFTNDSIFNLIQQNTGAESFAGIQVGRGLGGVGTMRFETGSTGTIDAGTGLGANLQVGRDGGMGLFEVLTDATFSLLGGSDGARLQIGRDAGEGRVNVAGTDSDLFLDGDTGGASIDVGRGGGGGRLNITGGASVRLEATGNSAFLVTAEDAGSEGRIDIDGIGSELLLTGTGTDAFLRAGEGGNSLIDLTNGGKIKLTSDVFAGMEVGKGSSSRIQIDETSSIEIEGTGGGTDANMVIGLSGGTGEVAVDGGTIEITAGRYGNIQVGTEFDHNENDAGIGFLRLDSGADVLFDVGESASMDIGGDAGSKGVVHVLNGSQIDMDVGDDAVDKGTIKIASHGSGSGALVVAGTGSRIRGLNYVQVGFDPDDDSSQSGGTGLLILSRGAELITDFISVATGGRLEADNARIDGEGKLTTGGIFDMQDGRSGAFELTGNFNSVGNGNKIFMDVGNGNDVITIGGDININNGAVNITLNAVDGFEFAQGEERVLVNLGGGLSGTRMEVAVTGQHAEFSYATGIYNNTSEFIIEALNSGDTGGVGLLDFGTINGPANLSYNLNTQSGTATGGRFGVQGARVYKVDSIVGTDDGDTIAIAGTAVRALTINTGDGNDTITGGRGKDIITVGFGDTDTIIFANKLHSGKTAATADQVIGFDDGGDGDKANVSALMGPMIIFIGTAAFSKPGQLRLVDIGADMLAEFNLTGNSGVDFAIRFVDTTPGQLAKGDFIL